MEAPVQLFVWSAKRIVPVRITEFSVMEEMFDANLNPICAKVSQLRVLSVYDLESTDLATSLGDLPAAEGAVGRAPDRIRL